MRYAYFCTATYEYISFSHELPAGQAKGFKLVSLRMVPDYVRGNESIGMYFAAKRALANQVIDRRVGL